MCHREVLRAAGLDRNFQDRDRSMTGDGNLWGWMTTDAILSVIASDPDSTKEVSSTVAQAGRLFKSGKVVEAGRSLETRRWTIFLAAQHTKADIPAASARPPQHARPTFFWRRRPAGAQHGRPTFSSSVTWRGAQHGRQTFQPRRLAEGATHTLRRPTFERSPLRAIPLVVEPGGPIAAFDRLA